MTTDVLKSKLMPESRKKKKSFFSHQLWMESSGVMRVFEIQNFLIQYFL